MKKITNVSAIFAFLCIALFSCKKNVSSPVDPISAVNNVYDASAKVSSSVSAFVTDENDVPVNGATVTAGTASTTTDSRGFFRINNVQVVKNAGFVTIDKPGYFKGIKTWIAQEGKSAFFRIKLLPKTSAGSVSGTTGGLVTLTGGMKISFPVNAAVNASTGAAYAGSITVNAKWLNPAAADINSLMPGDLRGLDAAGALKVLTTYGMAAVELRGAAGELLQMAPGKKATMTMPIPAAMQSNAPATLPLWYFDETKGLWKEEGTATKSGTDYVGDMSHFSFWNYDTQGNYIQFDVTITDAGNNPIPGVYVTLTDLSTGVERWAISNELGFVSGAIPSGTNFTLRVFVSHTCSVLYTQNFSSSTTNLSLPTIALISNRSTRIVGQVTDCSGAAVTNGIVTVYADNMFYTGYFSGSTGNYSIVIPVCTSGPVSATVIATNNATQIQSLPVINSYATGTTNTLNIQACNGGSSAQFLNYTLSDGTVRNFVYPADSVYLSPYNFGPPITYRLVGRKNPNGILTNISFGTGAPVVGQVYDISAFSEPVIASYGGGVPLPQVTFTEVGAPISGYIAGNITGSLPPINGGPSLTITGSFRTRRPY